MPKRSPAKQPKTSAAVRALKALIRSKQNAIVFFYMEQCPHCIHFHDIYSSYAADLAKKQSQGKETRSLQLFQMNGPRYSAEIHADPEMKEILFSHTQNDDMFLRGYPSILFLNSMGQVTTWPFENVSPTLARLRKDANDFFFEREQTIQ